MDDKEHDVWDMLDMHDMKRKNLLRVLYFFIMHIKHIPYIMFLMFEMVHQLFLVLPTVIEESAPTSDDQNHACVEAEPHFAARSVEFRVHRRAHPLTYRMRRENLFHFLHHLSHRREFFHLVDRKSGH